MASLFGFGATAHIDVVFSNVAGRAHRTLPSVDGSAPVQQWIYSSGEDIAGEVRLTTSGGKRMDHSGIKIELKGYVEIDGEKAPREFFAAVRELSGPGAVSGLQAHKFLFSAPALPHESYTGHRARVRYLARAIVSRSGYGSGGALSKDVEILVQNPIDAAVLSAAEPDASIKLEVGIEDCLHIEFEYDRSRYFVPGDVVTGRIDFLLVRIRIKHMEVAVIRRETIGSGSSASTESETLTRFEVMDGAPIRGERIPVRLYLSGLDLTPSYKDVAGCLSVKYFLNLVLIDEDERRYFKQQEVMLLRRAVSAE